MTFGWIVGAAFVGALMVLVMIALCAPFLESPLRKKWREELRDSDGHHKPQAGPR